MADPEVWTEVLNQRLAAVWVWTGADLGVVPVPLSDDVVLDAHTMEELGRYADDKEFNLYIEERYDEADFDGSLKEFTRKGAGVA